MVQKLRQSNDVHLKRRWSFDAVLPLKDLSSKKNTSVLRLIWKVRLTLGRGKWLEAPRAAIVLF